jgi:hypothetical protein
MPSNEGLNITFQQDKAGPVSVVVLTTSGEKVYSTALGKYPQGQSDITLTLDLKPGAYILRLLTAGKQQQTVVIKKYAPKSNEKLKKDFTFGNHVGEPDAVS